LLAAMRARGCGYAVVEASSHGLHQHRIAGFPVAVGGFTNLTRDHLDYHVTMDAYEAAKARLFGELAERACICIDEPAGRRLAASFAARFTGTTHDLDTRLWTVSTRGEGATLSAHDIHSDLSGLRCEVRGRESFTLTTPLIGRHNVENALVAIGMARLAGVPLDVILTALGTATGAPGRLQRVARPDGRGPICFVDYAHTPDALEQRARRRSRPLVHARGGQPRGACSAAGGDRDQGQAAGPWARPRRAAPTRLIATSDNPRSEDPALDRSRPSSPASAPPGPRVRGRSVDRAARDHRAPSPPRASGDAVLVAGKGHEDVPDPRRHHDAPSTTSRSRGPPRPGGPAGHDAPHRDPHQRRRDLPVRRCWSSTGGQLLARGASSSVLGVSPDTRPVAAGGLFFALRGERFDGHDYLGAVVAAGAGGVVVQRGRVPANVPVAFEVDDPQAALARLGAGLRRLHRGRFIAVTGSVGKTTVKDMIAAALTPFGKVGKTRGNLNNHLGVPLTLAALDGDEAFVVLELGMSAPGEIAALTALTTPHVRVTTRAAAAHLAFFRDVDAIADAKAEIYQAMPDDCAAVANADDPRMHSRAVDAVSPERLVLFGHGDEPHVRVLGAEHVAGRLSVSLAVAGASGPGVLEVRVAALGRHNGDNVGAALAACLALGLTHQRLHATIGRVVSRPGGPLPHEIDVDLRRAADALGAGFTPAKHRLERVSFGALTVIDDCYNANPESTLASILTFDDVCRDVPAEDRLAVIGSMRELGPTADALHADIGWHAANAVGTVLATGSHAAAVVSGVHPGVTAIADDDVAGHLPAIDAWVAAHPRGAILLKGSRGERLERVLDHLAARLSPPAGAR
jgi:murE/murF fusion protein